MLKTIGVGESTIDEMVAPLLKSTNPTIGVYAKPDGVYLRLAAKAASQEEAWVHIAPVEEEARRILGPIIWGADDDTLEGVVGDMLDERGLTLATMESCTCWPAGFDDHRGDGRSAVLQGRLRGLLGADEDGSRRERGRDREARRDQQRGR